ncbi:hypothetical protein DL96DRAFT_1709131 [Flagelloscypha sp. PMI_526]|nr:hypothetical protein DL96DRAFT_1709131 [Flagelloscypha sp. PMI_526]
MLTSEEDVELAKLGTLTALNAIQVGVLLGFYGVYIGLYPFSVVLILFNRPRLATKVILGLTTIIFVSTTMHAVSAFLAYMVFQVENFYRDVGTPLMDRRPLGRKDPRIIAAIAAYTWSQPINFIVTDSIIVWRAFALWRNTWVRLALVAAMLASATMSLIFASVSTEHHFSWLSNPKVDRQFAVSYLLLSQHRRQTVSVFTSSVGRPQKVLSIMILLVETGSALCLLQLIYAVVFLVTQSTISTWNTVRCAIQEATFVLVVSLDPVIPQFSNDTPKALYPSLLVVITLQQRFSVLDTAIQDRSLDSWHASSRATANTIDITLMQTVDIVPKLSEPARMRDSMPFDYK